MYPIAFSILSIASIVAWCCGLPRHGREDEYADINNSNNIDDEDKGSYKLPKNGELFEGDIVMDERLRRAVWGVQSKKSALKLGSKYLWPNGIIYYEIDKDFPCKHKKMLHEAMIEFKVRTCIRFVKRNKEENYIFYTAKNDECSSSIGMSGGKQIINLGRRCLVLGTFEHENMHALGFIHEHSRPDRDKYIEVNYDNIKRKEWNNFQRYKMDDVDNLKEDFNFASILLYRNDAFTKNGKDTLTALEDPDLEFGQRLKFSVGDVKEINNLYNCTRYQKDPNYHGLIKEYHIKRRKKDIVRKRIMRKLLEIQRRLHFDEPEK